MSNRSFTGLEKVLGASCCVLAITLVLLFVVWLREGIYLSIIAGKVSVLTEMDESAWESAEPMQVAVSAVRAASMAPQESESSADVILSLVASNTVRNMCALLQQRTGMNYGEDPIRWQRELSRNTALGTQSSRTQTESVPQQSTNE